MKAAYDQSSNKLNPPPASSSPDTTSGSPVFRMGQTIFWQSVAILVALMLLSGVLTQLIQAGSYDRTMRDGTLMVVPDSFHYLSSGEGHAYPFWRIFTAPFELFASSDALTVIIIILFILIVGGAFALFNETGVFMTMIDGMLARFRSNRTMLIAAFVLFFMLMGAIFGILEEIVPLIPVMVLVARRLGWDDFMGLGLSLLPAGFGFSAALTNPFTIGVAQELADVPAFSGMLYRILIFALTYGILLVFLVRYAKRLERGEAGSDATNATNATTATNVTVSQIEIQTAADTRRQTAVRITAIAFGILLVLMAVFSFVGLSDYSMPLIALGILLAAVSAAVVVKLPRGRAFKLFGAGVAGLAPSALLIILAMSVKHIFESSGIMDSVLYSMTNAFDGLGSVTGALAMYMLVFVLQFFIPSATAKAFLVIPLLKPLGDLLGITRQSVVLAFNFGDGFSHLLYPSNPMLLIALSMTTVSFVKWLRWTIGIQLVLFALTLIMLALAVIFGYGPL